MNNSDSTSSPAAMALPTGASEEDDTSAALDKFTISTLPSDPSLVPLTGDSFASMAGGICNFQIQNWDTKVVKVINITQEEIKLRCCGLIVTHKNAFCLKNKKPCQSHKNRGNH